MTFISIFAFITFYNLSELRVLGTYFKGFLLSCTIAKDLLLINFVLWAL